MNPSQNYVIDCYFVFLGTKVKRNTQIGTIKSWGPTFRVSVDLIIHSYGSGHHYRNIIAFKGNNGHNCCNNGDRVPAIWSHPMIGLHIVGSVHGRMYSFNYRGIKLGKKFNLVIEQVWINGEVCSFWYSLHLLYLHTSTKYFYSLITNPPVISGI